MRLDSLAYRWLWKLKRALAYESLGPHPIIWREMRSFEIPIQWRNSLSDDQRVHVDLVRQELEILSRIYRYLPKGITAGQWEQFLAFNTTRERFEYATFLRQKELRSEKDKRKLAHYRNRHMHHQEHCHDDDNDNIDDVSDDEHALNNNMFMICSAANRMKWSRQIECLRYINALRCEDTPKLVVDCRFLAMHSFRGMNLALKQLTQLIGENRRRAMPWPLYFTNFDDSSSEKLQKGRIKHMSAIDGAFASTVSVSASSYLDIFSDHVARKRLIYLSPHASEVLQKVEADTCYVIGGIVDRVAEPGIPLKASLQVSNEECLPCYRLPIKEYLEWGSGNQMLTIPGVAAILNDAFSSDSDWANILKRRIPSRKLKTPAEKCAKIRQKYKDLSVFKREILRILNEKTPFNL